MKKLLLCYPFSDPHIRLVEGFSFYDGAIGDEPGAPHRGIDYVLERQGVFNEFDVHLMHDGTAFQGISESWGNFVILSTVINGHSYSTVYAHLDSIPPKIPMLPQPADKTSADAGLEMKAGQKIGVAGTSGWTNGIIQLHIELHKKGKGNELYKLDPYGANDRASSGRYPQPGQPLTGLEHAWTSDNPPLAS